ncbi:hypothetical protein RHSIM_Rhsim11G0051200 [Rhododendron simsii]|uniref:F-box associated domain-containing protein n=1 Tax=Rhododendron simsii TaxID=118357 RepID=A0A834G9Z8_RHOSS|nr:hypothetical protein RHSIM_Rhsim11G0051200 [Rhododendron simsii]
MTRPSMLKADSEATVDTGIGSTSLAFCEVENSGGVTQEKRQLQDTSRHTLQFIVTTTTTTPPTGLEHYKLFIDTGEEDTNTFDEYLEVPFPLNNRGLHCYSLLGYVKGLFFFFERGKSFLWNPSIRRSISLPKPGITTNTHGLFLDYLGFGFDSQSTDYKVVRIVSLCGGTQSEEVPLVEVYSLNFGSWNESSGARNSFPLGCRLVYSRCPSACLEGAIHFVAQRGGNSGARLICSFDLGDEVFKTISLPNDLTNVRCKIRTTVFRGLLSLLCTDESDRANKFCSIWIMKEYGIVDSWYKYAQVDLTGGIMRVVGIRKNGHILFVGNALQNWNHWELSSYDPLNKEIKKLGTLGINFHVDTYEENLILLNKPNDPVLMKTNDTVSRMERNKKRKDRQCIAPTSPIRFGPPQEQIRLEHYKLFIGTGEEEDNTFDEYLEIPFPLYGRYCYVLQGYVKGPYAFPSLALPKRRMAAFWVYVGFGFDSRSNDYKVVRVVILCGVTRSEEVPLVEIYSLNSGSWKVSSEAGDSFPPGCGLEYPGRPSACLEGALHFVAHHRGNWGARLICSFDLGDELFKTMSLPNGLATTEMRAIVDSWYKYIKVDLAGGITRVAGIRKNGHILLEGKTPQHWKHWELYSYDPLNKEIKMLGILGVGVHFHVDTYEENLILLNITNDPVSRMGWSRKRKDR